MYQLGGKIAGGVDYVTATLKGVEAAGDGTLIGKQVGPGKVTEWVNTRHAGSNNKNNDEIKGLEASLAERIGNTGSGVSKEVSGVKGTGEGNRLIPGTPGKATGGSSTKLGQNLLESMGLPRSASWKGYQAQHIIPKNLKNHPVLKKIGMDMDHAENGIFLPIPSEDPSALSRHRGFHGVYNRVVTKALNNLDINQSVEVLEKQVYELQQKLKEAVEKGIPLYKSKIRNLKVFYKSGAYKDLPIWDRGGGATEELWERWINK
nr:AHH domain-containing protein [Bacillus sp. Xin1]